MTKTDIIRKLTSRKFWLAVAAFVSGLIVAFGGAESVAAEVSALIMSGASVLGYLLAEGLADAARSNTTEVQPGILVEEFITGTTTSATENNTSETVSAARQDE